MQRLAIALTFAGFSAACHESTSTDPTEFIWRPEVISYSIEQNERFGQQLRLDQKLRPDEQGWTMSRFDIPDTWNVVRIAVVGGALELELDDGRAFFVNADNFGSLSYAILDGAPRARPDSELDRIWQGFASRP